MTLQPIILRHDPSTEFFTAERCYITELSNSTTDEQLSIASARVAPGITTCWHSLADTVERYVIVSGQGVIEIGDLPPQHLTRFDVAIIPAGCKQRITNTGTIDLLFLALCTPRFLPDSYSEWTSVDETADRD
ncbi:cupin domain-containing protein [Chromatium okenii]|jgi:mannose-6-phosphate isomerase-like protein (cupin superfamily)|uniref:cupin domain-containing protein n=1 Tax=Chromatium okenii TaxID=61644 RepID=UPI001558F00A|nr:cupin domain-containing protein [Chromatium okenii]MBV5311383.1 cupin domain-containing protein [Chromatium okenii]